MIIGVDDVITTLGVSQVLQREIGDHLVGIHVDAGPSTPLELVDRELIEATLGNPHRGRSSWYTGSSIGSLLGNPYAACDGEFQISGAVSVMKRPLFAAWCR